MLMLLMFGNHIKAQNDVDCLYDSLRYTNGVCKKTIDATYLSFGKNPISPGNDKDDEIRKIKQRISYIPNSSVHFSYKEKEYYISIGNECDMTQYSEGDKIKIDIVFFEDIKQPCKYEKPFSLITSVTASLSAQGDTSIFHPSKERLVVDHPFNLGETFHGWKDGYGYILPPRHQFLKQIPVSYNGIEYDLGITDNNIIRYIQTSDKRFSVNGYKVGDEIVTVQSNSCEIYANYPCNRLFFFLLDQLLSYLLNLSKSILGYGLVPPFHYVLLCIFY